MPFVLLDGAVKTEWTTGPLRTVGILIGEKMDTFESFVVLMNAGLNKGWFPAVLVQLGQSSINFLYWQSCCFSSNFEVDTKQKINRKQF
mmetsp:Transcript_44056/g.56451  ORF Transcript_44056/g.56451 Transcript_44056/m.56451 type:complete len:89 (+) Transcript_44056:969-1235(+)